MTPQELAYWQRINRRASSLSPEVRNTILRAFEQIRELLSDTEIARLVSTNQIDKLFDTTLSQARFDAAMQPVRDRIRSGIADGVKFFSRDVPKPKGVTFAFDTLNPDVITAIRKLESRVITKLQDDVRETVRAYVENGLRDGSTPASIGKQIRNVVGLSPAQETQVGSFRALLESADKGALQRQLRDKRFDATIEKAFGGDGLSAQQIDKMVDAYRRKFVAFNAETVARTASSDAAKLGQRISIDKAVEMGVYDPDRLKKTWVGVMDDRERGEHVAMEGEIVPYDEPFSNGEMIPGDSTWNCRCVARYAQLPQG